MVFRGKPSKACERCRARRLRCDLRTVSCGQCIRADVPCSGYRDTELLRIRNESKAVIFKALKGVPVKEQPKSLTLSIDLQARDAFFAYYVTSTSKCWDFLKRYYHPADTPVHLTLAIEAVSLAYLWHQVYSDAALATARERYVLALRMTQKALRSSEEASKETTLLASLLLDLFEKITDTVPRNCKSWKSHIEGALAIANFRGLAKFQDPAEFRILVRLSTNYLISCVASASPVPDELIALRTYVGNLIDAQDPKWQLNGLMISYASLLSEVQTGVLSGIEYMARCEELDSSLKALDFEMPLPWKASTTFPETKSERMFEFHFDTYADRNVTQARNVLRCVRILLNESLIELYLASCMNDDLHASTILSSVEKSYHNIETLSAELCASVPQFTHCDGPAREKLPLSETSKTVGGHPHTPNHVLDCYTLLFPLYIAGQSKFGSSNVRPWVIKQLKYIGEHFYIRNALVIAEILETGNDANPWDVYAILGSYAVAA